MKRYKKIENGEIVNIILADAKFAADHGYVEAADDDAIPSNGVTYTEDQARQIRNKKLADTDWWAVSDRTMTSEETAYRQALRDLPDHADWPNMDWPTKP